MSDTHAILEADFATWRPVQGRKVLQLVFEVPLEKTQEVLAKLGTPLPGQSIWVAIAKLDLQASKASGSNTNSVANPQPPSTVTESPSVVNPALGVRGRTWNELGPGEQAGIRCSDAGFREFLSVCYPKTFAECGNDTAETVRVLCGVRSRGDLKYDDSGKKAWEGLDAHYRSYGIDRQYSEAKRHG